MEKQTIMTKLHDTSTVIQQKQNQINKLLAEINLLTKRAIDIIVDYEGDE